MEQKLESRTCPKSRGGAAAGNRPSEEPSSLACTLCDYPAPDVKGLNAHVRSHIEPSSSLWLHLWLPRVYYTDVPSDPSSDGARDSGGRSSSREDASRGPRAGARRAAGEAHEVDGQSSSRPGQHHEAPRGSAGDLSLVVRRERAGAVTSVEGEGYSPEERGHEGRQAARADEERSLEFDPVMVPAVYDNRERSDYPRAAETI
eukprot:1734526-Pyramimonas_sp.AAC.1